MSCCHEKTESKGVRKIYHLVKLIVQLDLKWEVADLNPGPKLKRL